MRQGRSRAEAGQADLRGGGGRADGGAHGSAGTPRPGQDRAGAARPGQRCLGRRGQLRGADRQGARCPGDRRVQHRERRDGPLDRRRPRHRLHARRLHPVGAAIRRHLRQRREPAMVAAEAHPRTGGDLDAAKVTPVIDRQYAFADIADALAYLGEGHARGKSSSPGEPLKASHHRPAHVRDELRIRRAGGVGRTPRGPTPRSARLPPPRRTARSGSPAPAERRLCEAADPRHS